MTNLALVADALNGLVLQMQIEIVKCGSASMTSE
jgi:hypothetical protein